jgi:hypothetical protein
MRLFGVSSSPFHFHTPLQTLPINSAIPITFLAALRALSHQLSYTNYFLSYLTRTIPSTQLYQLLSQLPYAHYPVYSEIMGKKVGCGKVHSLSQRESARKELRADA